MNTILDRSIPTRTPADFRLTPVPLHNKQVATLEPISLELIIEQLEPLQV